MRQAMLAALLLSPAAVSAEVRAIIDGPTGSIHISGLEARERHDLVENPEDIFLQIESLQGHGAIALTVLGDQDTLVVQPRFSLLPGEAYVLRLGQDGEAVFETTLRVPSTEISRPDLSWRAPAAAVIPENTLRLYLMFSEPMAIGQVRDAVWLERADGAVVDSPFLNLQTELWDGGQRRLTLLFDPGRIKRGVGPNESDGAPLQDGERYVLVLSPDLASAAGAPLGSEIRLPLTVGPAQRDLLDPSAWAFTAPAIGSTDPLNVHFDRLMDRGAAERLIAVVGPSGDTVPGVVEATDHAWHFAPTLPWSGTEGLRIDPDLEDVAGNTIHAPFDAASGAMGHVVDDTTVAIFGPRRANETSTKPVEPAR